MCKYYVQPTWCIGRGGFACPNGEFFIKSGRYSTCHSPDMREKYCPNHPHGISAMAINNAIIPGSGTPSDEQVPLGVCDNCAGIEDTLTQGTIVPSPIELPDIDNSTKVRDLRIEELTLPSEAMLDDSTSSDRSDDPMARGTILEPVELGNYRPRGMDGMVRSAKDRVKSLVHDAKNERKSTHWEAKRKGPRPATGFEETFSELRL